MANAFGPATLSRDTLFQREDASAGRESWGGLCKRRGVEAARMLTWMCRPTSVIGVRRTWRGLVSMSANDPQRTFQRKNTYFTRAAIANATTTRAISAPRPMPHIMPPSIIFGITQNLGTVALAIVGDIPPRRRAILQRAIFREAAHLRRPGASEAQTTLKQGGLSAARLGFARAISAFVQRRSSVCRPEVVFPYRASK